MALMLRTLVATVIVSTTLPACGKPYEDAAAVWIVPINCDCDAEFFACGEFCPEGDYPEDTAFMVSYAIPGSAIEIHNERCEIEQTGEFELTVHTSWREQDREDIATLTYFECDDMTPPLAAGVWTIVTGGGSGTLRIPSTMVEAVCVDPSGSSGCIGF